MLETLIDALLPIVVTLLLGFFAGWHHDFAPEQSQVLNRMVMLYALPLSLFAGLMGTPRSQLFGNLPMFFWLTLAMAGGYVAVFLISRCLFRRPRPVAALQALAIAGPAVPFIGGAVLGTLFGNDSAIAICGLLMNLIQVPLCLILLAPDPPSGNVGARKGAAALLFRNILHAIREPVVWAPVAGFALVLAGYHLPAPLRDSFTLLGRATGGVALFSSGVVLYAQKVSLTLPVGVNVLAKNILLPALIALAMYLFGTAEPIRSLTMITLAIPTASIAIIFAVQYRAAEKEMASTLFLSTLLSAITMGLFIALSGAAVGQAGAAAAP